MPGLADQGIDRQVARNAKQPTAEGTLGRVILLAFDGQGDGAEDLLRQVGRVSVLQAFPPRQPVDERSVNLQELGPRLLVTTVAETDQQTQPGRRHLDHAPTSTSRYNGRGEFLAETESPCENGDCPP